MTDTILTENEILSRILSLNVERAAVPRTEFKARYVLSREADELRSSLKRLQRDQLAAARSEWSTRAAHKGTHVESSTADAARLIVSPHDLLFERLAISNDVRRDGQIRRRQRA